MPYIWASKSLVPTADPDPDTGLAITLKQIFSLLCIFILKFSKKLVFYMNPEGGTTTRKRKRMRRAELINALASDSPAHKRRSSVADLALLSMSASFLDNTDKNLLTPEPPQPAERMSSAAPR